MGKVIRQRVLPPCWSGGRTTPRSDIPTAHHRNRSPRAKCRRLRLRALSIVNRSGSSRRRGSAAPRPPIDPSSRGLLRWAPWTGSSMLGEATSTGKCMEQLNCWPRQVCLTHRGAAQLRDVRDLVPRRGPVPRGRARTVAPIHVAVGVDSTGATKLVLISRR